MKNPVSLVFAFSKNLVRCGVNEYVENLYAAMRRKPCKEIFVAESIFNVRAPLSWHPFRQGGKVEITHLQYPMEAWGASILPGIFPFVFSSRKRGRLVVTLHEWQRMHFLRRMSVAPLALFAKHLVFVSRREFFAFSSSFVGRARRWIFGERASIIPIGVNVEQVAVDSLKVEQKRAGLLKNLKRPALVLGFFGFIYAAKQPEKLLDIVCGLLSEGIDARLVICGGFPDGHEEKQAKFLDLVRLKGLVDVVDFLGYVEDPQELATTLAACDINVQLYDDGVSARRGSYWYAVDLGLRVLTTAPPVVDEFTEMSAHNPLADPRVIVVPVKASVHSIVEKLREIVSCWEVPQRRSCSPSWESIAAQHFDLYKKVLNEK